MIYIFIVKASSKTSLKAKISTILSSSFSSCTHFTSYVTTAREMCTIHLAQQSYAQSLASSFTSIILKLLSNFHS